MLIKRLILTYLILVVLTVLCEAGNFDSVIVNKISDRSLRDDDKSPDRYKKVKKPKARDDAGSTMEETIVIINVLSNDEMDREDDDDDDAPMIDPATVDLDPPTNGIDRSVNNITGNFSVNSAGEVSYLPSVNFTGTTSIRYSVRDSEGNTSNTASVTITVSNVNDAPVITGQTPDPLTVNEDQPLTIGLNHLVVTDPDDNYPGDFTLSVAPGTNYTVSGTTVTPDPDYSGSLTVPVTVNDGEANSNVFNFRITVLPVNDAPVISAQTPDPFVISEEQPVTLSLSNLVVSDNDDAYPADFTLQVSPGANYTVSGSTVTPAVNFNGVLSIPVLVNDGESSSNSFNVQITVAAVNDVPVINGQTPDPLATIEEQAIAIEFGHLQVSDPDDVYPSGFTMVVSPGTNYSVSGTTITPAPDFSGLLTVPVTVNDGEVNSNTFSLEVNVAGSNDVPVITGQSALAIEEDNSITIITSHLMVSDSDNPYPTGFTIAIGAGTNYTFSGSTVTPSVNFSGVLSVPVTVNDGTSNSQPFSLQITVNPVNDVPVITGQSPLSTSESQPVEVTLSHLTVSDPDDIYPTDFTLTLLAGANYSVSGSVLTPAAGFNGILSVGVIVNDGVANSGVFSLQVPVSAVNDPPVITGQNPLSVAEDNTITLLLSDLTVTDTDNTYPTGFTLSVLPGDNYTFSGTSVTPAPDFTGTLSVSVKVNDGSADSAPFAVQISITPVNDDPQITGQQTISANEDQPVPLALSHFIVTDPDNAYPAGFALIVFSGANYTISANTITPSPGFNGTLTVPVQVNDGVLNSNIFEAQVTVVPVNNPPVITGQLALSTQEDVPVTIQLAHLTVFDSDNTYPTGFTLSVSAGTNYTVSGTTVTPAIDFTGTLNVTVTVNDGVTASAPFNFQIQVGDTNDPPVITGQTPVSTNEEQAITIALSHLTVTDPDNSYPTGFTLLVSEGANFTVSGSTVTPVLNFAGVLSVPVRVNDGINNSATFDFKIQVNQINDPPSFDAIPNQVISENAAEVRVPVSNISKGPGESDQQVTFVVTSSNTAVIPNPVISYNPAESAAMLTYKPVANASGVVAITIVAVDNGSNGAPHQNSYSSTFQVEVTEINSAPTLDAIANVQVNEDAPEQSINLTGITAGAGETQALTVEVVANHPELFEILSISYVTPQASGILQIKAKANMSGVATVTVRVTDAGSATTPSVNTISRSFTFTIQAVNDPPVFISTPVILAAVNEPYEYVMEIKDIENGSLSFSVVSKPAWATLTAEGNGKAKLRGVPPPGSAGSSAVTIRVNDTGIAVEHRYTLIVNTRPVLQVFAVNMEEDEVMTFQSQHFTGAYTDADQHSLSAIVITQKPGAGMLVLGDREVSVNDTIPFNSLGSITYKPQANYAGLDAFYWKASDGYHFNLTPVAANIEILPVNDGPQVILAEDTLVYEVNGEEAFLSELIEADDPDDDSLTHAEIGFTAQHFSIEFDRLQFENTVNIKGTYDFQTGKLSLAGKAPVEEYIQALRSIQYVHFNTLDPDLAIKSLFIRLNDGKVWGETKELLIDLEYTFIELEIPSGFTPNGDSANDTWVITRPGGIDQLDAAIIRVFNKRGVQVFHARGFDHAWDGTYNGQVLPADTYFFTIDLKLRNKKRYSGIVTILR